MRYPAGGTRVSIDVGVRQRLLASACTAAALGLGLGGSAADSISLTVRPLVNPTNAYGAVSSGKAGVKVTLQFKQCGLYPAQFRDLRETTTAEGGAWAIDTGAPTNGAFRAVSSDAVSDDVKVLARADVRLSPYPRGRYRVAVVAWVSFWRRPVMLQRFDRSRRTWVTVQKLSLQNTFGPGLIWSTTGKFKPKVPKGTTVRAVLPLTEAKPCYIGGYSNLLRT
jgi:hypothetical protein